MEQSDKTTATTYKTLWTETIFEVLYLALKYDKPDKDVREILRMVKLKGSKSDYIIRKVNQKLGEVEAQRVRMLLQQ